MVLYSLNESIKALGNFTDEAGRTFPAEGEATDEAWVANGHDHSISIVVSKLVFAAARFRRRSECISHAMMPLISIFLVNDSNHQRTAAFLRASRPA